MSIGFVLPFIKVFEHVWELDLGKFFSFCGGGIKPMAWYMLSQLLSYISSPELFKDLNHQLVSYVKTDKLECIAVTFVS